MNHEIAARTQERTYILPHPALRTVISHYTIFHPRNRLGGTPSNARLNVLPDASGCIVCAFDSSGINLRYWGPTSKSVSVDNGDAVQPTMLLVEFLPGGASLLLHMPLHSLQDRIVALDCVDGDLHRSICGEARQNDLGAFMHALNRIFLLRIGERGTPPLAAHILSSVLASRGMARIGELARETGYSARHLNRVVTDSVGINLKLFSRIVRINAACHALSVPNLSLTALAQRFDYHDQAHFIHDFKSICGVAPGKFRSAMSHFYNEDLKLLGIIPGK